MIRFKEVLHSISHMLYPDLCAACLNSLHEGEKYLCLTCQYGLPKTGFHTHEANPLERVFWGRCTVEKGAAYLYFEKESGVQQLMHHIKYRGCKELAQMMGEWYGKELNKLAHYKNIDCIIPVPLHEKKLRSRGFNQSEWFGKGLSEALGIPILTNHLVRTANSDSQTRKNRSQRWDNVSEIFAVKDPEALKDKKILLVDDVVTTGATLEACTQTILALNCGSKISIATLAFAS